MARNEWNTQFPEMGELTLIANHLAESGYDVHTVTIVLDDGFWRVIMSATDTDLVGQTFVYEMSQYGALQFKGVRV